MFQMNRMHVKIILMVSTVLFLAGVLSGWLSARRESEKLISDMRIHASVMVRNFADTCARFLLLNDYAELETFLVKTVDLPDIVRLQVCEVDGLVVGEASKKNGSSIPESSILRIKTPSEISQTMTIENGHLIVWQPITAGNMLGWIRADYSMASITQAQAEAWTQGLLMSMIWVLGSAGLILILLRPATRSLEKLTVFARGLSENKGAGITVDHFSIEIGELEASLNFASANLFSAKQQLISDREELRKSEENYRRLLDTIQEGIWVIDADSVTTFVNPRMSEILGYSQEEMLGMDIFSFIDEEGKAAARLNLEKRMQGIREEHDFKFVRRDGTRILARLETGPILDASGKYSGAIAAVADVTEKRIAEQALKEKQGHSQSLLRLSRELEHAETSQEVLEASRDEVKAILGYKTLWVYLLSEDRKHFRALIAKGSASGAIMSWDSSTILTVAGDRMLEEIAEAKDIVVVEDARTDERTNKELVARLGNRTIVNVPIMLFDRHIGSVGTGTFGDEGVRPPSKSEGEYLLALAGHIAVTLNRIRLFEQVRRNEEALHKLNEELEQRVRDRTTELEKKNSELEQMNRLFVGRELRMVELKERIRSLESGTGIRESAS